MAMGRCWPRNYRCRLGGRASRAPVERHRVLDPRRFVRVALARLSLKGLKHASSGVLDHRAWLSVDE
jgi:hypothetical protein